MLLLFKGEAEKVENKIVENNLYMIAHNRTGFDSYVVLNNLPQWRSVVNLIKNGIGNIALKTCNGHVIEKKIPSLFILDVGEFILLVVWRK